MKSGKVIEHVICRGFLIELKIRCQKRESALDLDRLILDADAIVKYVACIRLDECREHAHGRCLTCAVRSQKSEDLSGICSKADVADCYLFTVRQILRTSLRFTDLKSLTKILSLYRVHKYPPCFLLARYILTIESKEFANVSLTFLKNI